MVNWLDAGVVIQGTQWNNRELALGVKPRHGGTAHFAEDLGEVTRVGYLVGLQVILTPEETDSIKRRESIARMSGRPPNRIASQDLGKRLRSFNTLQGTAKR